MTAKLNITNFLHGGDYNPEQWIDQPEIIEADFNAFKDAKINTFSLGIFSWAKLEPEEGTFDFSWLDEMFDKISAQNGQVILSTPSGARPRWLAEKYPEVLRVNKEGERQLYGERHNHCYTSPAYRDKVQIINRKLAERYGHNGMVILWHISNEYGGECYCDLCQAEFRKWLKKKYQTIEHLNHAYWATFWSHNYTSWNQIQAPMPNGDTGVLGLNLDWRRFVSDQTINFFDEEIKPLHEITPEIPVTTNFMGGNPPESHVFYDLDYQKFAKHVDVVSWDSYPNWANDYESTAHLAMKTALMNDVMRSLKMDNYLIMESTPSQVNWHPYNRAKRPGMHEMASLQEISHGANSIMYFQLHQSLGSSEMFHGAVISNQMKTETRAYQDVSKVGNDLEKLNGGLLTKHRKSKVAIVFDYANMWALDDSRNYAAETKKYWRTIREHYQYFWENDIPVDIISTEQDMNDYKLVIDPMHFLMSDTFSEKLASYVKRGGRLVGTYVTGVVDSEFLTYQGGWPKGLRDSYGIEIQETDTLYPKQKNNILMNNKMYMAKDYCEVIKLKGANVLGIYQDDFYKKTPAITKNNFGKGVAYYQGCRLDNEFLANFYHEIVQELNIMPELSVKKMTKNVSVQTRDDGVNQYYFIINFSHENAKIELTTPLNDVLLEEMQPVGSTILPAYGVKVLVEKIKKQGSHNNG
ncbi:beta-galactosidase [Dellaglioa algida]|uniref:beta-galactosidase n=1 Tax=Dellaglioa algida TaxID=105612 RepID=UPI0024C4B13F|nr:beta-galactosidase [Dellaglioa algida]MDK1727954.1 beta-galactosidase [Dellaglioa algida]MDK1735649.1 beta-galactosidase [Dellaglioa algida]MDK1737285.1 beta-galactosidase [Dellaglioa algida]